MPPSTSSSAPTTDRRPSTPSRAFPRRTRLGGGSLQTQVYLSPGPFRRPIAGSVPPRTVFPPCGNPGANDRTVPRVNRPSTIPPPPRRPWQWAAALRRPPGRRQLPPITQCRRSRHVQPARRAWAPHASASAPFPAHRSAHAALRLQLDYRVRSGNGAGIPRGSLDQHHHSTLRPARMDSLSLDARSGLLFRLKISVAAPQRASVVTHEACPARSLPPTGTRFGAGSK